MLSRWRPRTGPDAVKLTLMDALKPDVGFLATVDRITVHRMWLLSCMHHPFSEIGGLCVRRQQIWARKKAQGSESAVPVEHREPAGGLLEHGEPQSRIQAVFVDIESEVGEQVVLLARLFVDERLDRCFLTRNGSMPGIPNVEI